MSNLAFAEKLATLKLKLPSFDKICDAVFSFLQELFFAIHILLELAFNLIIILCALKLFNAGIDLYMLRNGGNISKVVIEIGAYVAFIIPAIVVKNIILRYI